MPEVAICLQTAPGWAMGPQGHMQYRCSPPLLHPVPAQVPHCCMAQIYIHPFIVWSQDHPQLPVPCHATLPLAVGAGSGSQGGEGGAIADGAMQRVATGQGPQGWQLIPCVPHAAHGLSVGQLWLTANPFSVLVLSFYHGSWNCQISLHSCCGFHVDYNKWKFLSILQDILCPFTPLNLLEIYMFEGRLHGWIRTDYIFSVSSVQFYLFCSWILCYIVTSRKFHSPCLIVFISLGYGCTTGLLSYGNLALKNLKRKERRTKSRQWQCHITSSLNYKTWFSFLSILFMKKKLIEWFTKLNNHAFYMPFVYILKLYSFLSVWIEEWIASTFQYILLPFQRWSKNKRYPVSVSYMTMDSKWYV